MAANSGSPSPKAPSSEPAMGHPMEMDHSKTMDHPMN
jgi:hypothetical protein